MLLDSYALGLLHVRGQNENHRLLTRRPHTSSARTVYSTAEVAGPPPRRCYVYGAPSCQQPHYPPSICILMSLFFFKFDMYLLWISDTRHTRSYYIYSSSCRLRIVIFFLKGGEREGSYVGDRRESKANPSYNRLRQNTSILYHISKKETPAYIIPECTNIDMWTDTIKEPCIVFADLGHWSCKCWNIRSITSW